MGYDVSTLVHTPFMDARICVCLSVRTELKDGRNVYTEKHTVMPMSLAIAVVHYFCKTSGCFSMQMDK